MKKQDLRTGDIPQEVCVQNNNKCITILSQAFYGNRTATRIRPEKVDLFILGYLDDYHSPDDLIDRTIIKVPDSDNVVIIYNKFEEEKALKDKEKYFLEDNYVMTPLASIAEAGIEIYSRCIACRLGDDGTLQSLESEDMVKLEKYFSM